MCHEESFFEFGRELGIGELVDRTSEVAGSKKSFGAAASCF
jgi:hypothetical protein